MNTRKKYKKIDRKIRYKFFIFFIVACVSFFTGNNHLFPDKTEFEREFIEKLELSTYGTPIIINEIYTGDAGSGEYIELYNNGPDILMNNWSLEIYSSNALNKTYHFPTDWVFKRNYVVVIEQNGDPVNNNDTFLFTGWDIAWGGDPVACGLFYDGDDNKLNVDWIQSNDHAGDAPSDAKWTEDTPLTLDNRWAYRTGDIDNNLASDWTTSTTGGSKGLINSRQIGYDHAPSTSSIKINEIFVGLNEWIEIYNYGSDRNMTGWKVKIYDNAGLNTSYDFPENWIFNNNHVVVLEEGGSASNNNDTTLHAEGLDFNLGKWAWACGIFDGNEVNVDWIQANSYIGPRPSHAEWVEEPTVTCGGSDYIYRTSDIDRDKASDWINSSSGTRGALNSGQTGNYYLPDSSIVINEICTATPDYIEMYNYGPDRNMTGWYMEIYDENLLDVTYDFPDGWMFIRNTIVTLYDECINNLTTTNRLNTTLDIPWSSTDPLGCGIFDDNGACVDWFQSSHHVLHLPPHAEWEQDIEIYLTSNYSCRINDIDTNEASDWEISLTGSEGSLNTGQVGNRHSATTNDFLFHKNITIDSVKVNGTGIHEDFPVLISLIDTDLHYEARSDGGDIAFFQGTTKLDHEIELFNQLYSATEAQLVAWVRIPSLSSNTNTTFAMYYGNSSLCKQEHPEGVWDEQYKGVWHLNDNPLETIFDSTCHNNDGASIGMTTGNQVNGKIDGGLDFDNVDDRVDLGNDQSLDITEQMTVEAWINIGSYGTDMEYILAKRMGGETAYLFGIGNDGKVTVGNRGNWAQSTSSITQNVWHHVVGIIDGTDATICVDGELFYQESGISPLSLDSSLRLVMGARWETDFPEADYFFNGIMDEVRISNLSRSTDWIATQYNNVNDPSSFYSVGSQNDPLPPTTNISYDSLSPNFINVSTLFSLSSDDGRGVGVSFTTYRIDGGSWAKYIAPFNLGGYGEGNHAIEFYSGDFAGNNESIQSEEVYLDMTAPTTSIIYTPEYVPNFITSSTSFILTPSDGSGSSVANTYYHIDSDGWNAYSGAFTLSGYSLGNHVIYYYSIDNIGNIESTQSEEVYLDSFAPSTDISYTPLHGPNYINTGTSFTLNFSDGSGSGVANTYYHIDSDGWNAYSGAFTLSGYSPGNHVIYYYSIDNIGNVESTQSEEVYLDSLAPSTDISYTPLHGPNYITTGTSFKLNFSDGSGSGVANTYYHIDSNGWSTYSGAFTLTGYSSGSHTIYYYSIDNAQNMENIKSIVVIVDEDAPSTIIEYTMAFPSNFVNTSTQFTFSANDGSGSGVATTYYQLDGTGGSWIVYSSSIDLDSSSEGFHTIYFYSVDNVGNDGSISSTTVYLDVNAPLTLIVYSGASPNFIADTTQISFTGNDGTGSGMAFTSFRIDGGSWNSYSGPFTLSGYSEGNHTIYFNSTDNVGNIESTNTTTVYLDKSAPLTQIIYSGVFPNFIKDTTQISFTGNDGTGSGLSITSYRIDGEGWNTYSGPFTLSGYSEGIHTIYFNSTDNVGNIESTNSTTVYLDKSAPSTSIQYFIAYGPNVINDTTIFSLTSNDGVGSGTTITSFRIDGGIWNTYSTPFTLSGYSEGIHTIYFNSTDNLGNIESTNFTTVYLDINTATTSLLFSSLFSPDYVNSTTQFILSANDGTGSGINIIAYQIDGGSWTDYSGPFTLSGADGIHWICFNSTDNVGNVEIFNNITIYLYNEKDAPITNINFALFIIPNYVNSSTLFTLTSNDSLGSGVAHIYYKIDAKGTWTEYLNPFSLNGYGLGIHTIYYYSIDNVGNNGTIESIIVNHVITAPPNDGDNPMILIIIVVFISIGLTVTIGVIIKVKRPKGKKYMIPEQIGKEKKTLIKLDKFAGVSLVNSCLNDLLTDFGNDSSNWYYCEPRIYLDIQKKSDGLILNKQNFLHTRLTGTDERIAVSTELGIDPNNIGHIKAIQVFFASDLSQENILDICLKYQTPDLMNIIVGIKWPKFEYERVLDVPSHDELYYRDNFRIISPELFVDFIGLSDKYRTNFNKIIKYGNNFDIASLKKILGSEKVIPHYTEDLRDDLREMGLINNYFDEYFKVW